jgi:tRNA(fMet)-specific endonuclease VapC
VLIHLRQGRPAVLEAFRARRVEDLVLSVVTVGELAFGVERSQHRDLAQERLEAMLAVLNVEPLPVEAAAHYGEIRARLSARGMMIGGSNLWIAAHARARGYVLVTDNEGEFERVEGLTVENWARA